MRELFYYNPFNRFTLKIFSRFGIMLIALGLLFGRLDHAFAEIGLNLDGVTGSAINPNAFIVPSTPSSNLYPSWEGIFGLPKLSTHFVELEPVGGDLKTFHITKGFFGRFELGYTRQSVSSTDLNIVHGKLQLLKENFKGIKTMPALAIGAIYRNVEGDIPGYDYGTDYYLVATKFIPIQLKSFPAFSFVPTVGIRSTKARGNGLLGFTDNRKLEFEGIFEIVTDRVILGMDYKGQPESDNWFVYFIRFNIFKNLQLDLALGDLGEDLHDQFIIGLSFRP
jgi:hypothetical protein